MKTRPSLPYTLYYAVFRCTHLGGSVSLGERTLGRSCIISYLTLSRFPSPHLPPILSSYASTVSLQTPCFAIPYHSLVVVSCFSAQQLYPFSVLQSTLCFMFCTSAKFSSTLPEGAGAMRDKIFRTARQCQGPSPFCATIGGTYNSHSIVGWCFGLTR